MGGISLPNARDTFRKRKIVSSVTRTQSGSYSQLECLLYLFCFLSLPHISSPILHRSLFSILFFPPQYSPICLGDTLSGSLPSRSLSMLYRRTNTHTHTCMHHFRAWTFVELSGSVVIGSISQCRRPRAIAIRAGGQTLRQKRA